MGVVDQDVDRTESSHGFLYQVLQIVFLGDITDRIARFCTFGFQDRHRILKFCLPTATDHDVGAGLREADRDLLPDPAPAAGDDGCFPV